MARTPLRLCIVRDRGDSSHEGLLKSQVRRHNKAIFSMFFYMKVYCVAILMSTHNIAFLDIKMKIIPSNAKICNYGICSKGPKNEF